MAGRPLRRRRRVARPARSTPQPRGVRRRVFDALSQIREGKSFTAAARDAGVDRGTFKRHAGRLLRKRRGHYVAMPIDQLARPMRVLTEEGLITLDLPDSRSASRNARFFNAVHHYLRTGKAQRLQRFAGRRLRVDGVDYPFVTDLGVLERLAQAGQVQFEDLYETSV